MNLWILKVLNEFTTDWEASTYKGDVIVRAPDESTARRMASERFYIASGRKLGEIVKVSPWEQSQLVSCEKYPGDEYPMEGEISVLFPSNS